MKQLHSERMTWISNFRSATLLPTEDTGAAQRRWQWPDQPYTSTNRGQVKGQEWILLLWKLPSLLFSFNHLKRVSYKFMRHLPLWKLFLGSDLAGEAAAALAATSIVFRKHFGDVAYADQALRHARNLFSFADQYRGKHDQWLNGFISWDLFRRRQWLHAVHKNMKE